MALAIVHVTSVGQKLEGEKHARIAQSSKRDAADPGGPSAGANQGEQTATADQSEQDKNWHDKEDLAAQRRMADSAEQQVLISAGSLLLLGFTAWFTYWAAQAAKNAARSALRSADIAQETLNKVQDTAKRELRAYMGMSEHNTGTVKTGFKGRAMIKIENFGQTPAYKVRHAVKMKVFGVPGDFSLEPDESTRVVNPRDAFVVACEMDEIITQSDADGFLDNTKRIFSWGVIKYEDAFGDPHTTKFSLEYGGGHTREVGAFAYSDDGNEAD